MNATEQTIKKSSRVHTSYHTKGGDRVPSVTTALGELSKPALIPWAWKLGKQGIDYRTYRDELADVGTLAHKMILDHLQGNKTDTADYSPNQVDLAENCFLSYLEWERQRLIEPILVEAPLVSEISRYGGTPDFYGLIDGVQTVMDFKTGKGIYPEYFYQLAAYGSLIMEVNPLNIVRQYRILNIGRSEDEKFQDEVRTDLGREFEIFLAALRIYKLKKHTEET
jgi:hypothetical protein